MQKGQLINAKSMETGMLLEIIEKMVEIQNLQLNRLNIHNGSEGLAPVSLQEALQCAIAQDSTTLNRLSCNGDSTVGNV